MVCVIVIVIFDLVIVFMVDDNSGIFILILCVIKVCVFVVDGRIEEVFGIKSILLKVSVLWIFICYFMDSFVWCVFIVWMVLMGKCKSDWSCN